MTPLASETVSRYTFRQALLTLSHYYSLRELPGTLRTGLLAGALLAFSFIVLTAFVVSLSTIFFLAFPSDEIVAKLAKDLPHLSQNQLMVIRSEAQTEFYHFARDVFVIFASGCVLCGGGLRLAAYRRTGNAPMVVVDAAP